MPNWRFARVFGPRRVLSSRVVNSAGKVTLARAKKRRLLLLDVLALVWLRRRRDVRGGQRDCAAIDVALRPISSPTLRPPARPRGRRRRGNNGGNSAETATSLHHFDAIGLRHSRMTNAPGHITEAALPKRHLVRLFRAVISHSGQSIPPNK